MAFTGQTIENPVTGETITFLRTAAETDGELVEIEVTVQPDGAVAAAHVHPYQSERFEILEGTLEFRNGREAIRSRTWRIPMTSSREPRYTG